MSNSRTNPWYDQECKDARKEIKQSTTYSIKMDKINHYKALIKRKKRHYLSKRQEILLHPSKVASKKLWRKILTRKTKEENKISLKDWNSYLKKLYESPDIKEHSNPSYKERIFLVRRHRFRG